MWAQLITTRHPRRSEAGLTGRGVDILFFRNHIWERLAASVGIVLVFVALYFRFLHIS